MLESMIDFKRLRQSDVDTNPLKNLKTDLIK